MVKYLTNLGLNQTVVLSCEETAQQSHSFVSNHGLRFLPNTDPMLYPQIRYSNEKMVNPH